jgi:hypothetical protein
MTKAQQKTRRETQLNQAYDFFLEAEEAQRTFTAKDIQRSSHFPISIIQQYIAAQWSWFLQRNETDQTLRVHGLKGYPRQYFLDLHDSHLSSFLKHACHSSGK